MLFRSYADTHGTEHDAWLPHAWRYRDHLVRAFNADLPYDQFIREHIAGDQLPVPRWNRALGVNESLLASAWWRLVEFNQTPVDVKGEEVIVVDSQIDAYSKAFLGLTVSCARCHDHKFDPISQRDFHGLYSILASTRTSMRVLDPPEMLDAKNAELTALKTQLRSELAAKWRKQIDQWPVAIAQVRAAKAEEKSSGEVVRWRSAFASARTNKTAFGQVLRALGDGGDVRGDAKADKGEGQGARVFADFSDGSDCGWFATGGFARHAPSGEWCVKIGRAHV